MNSSYYPHHNHLPPHVAPMSQPFSPEGMIDIEKSEPIVRLLAHVRKGGMDILFPQISHDKVSMMCLFALSSFSSRLI